MVICPWSGEGERHCWPLDASRDVTQPSRTSRKGKIKNEELHSTYIHTTMHPVCLFHTITVSHKVIMFFPEVNRKPALFLFLYISDTGDVEEELAKTVLRNETSKPVNGQKESGERVIVGVIYLQSSSSTGTSAVHQMWPKRHCTC